MNRSILNAQPTGERWVRTNRTRRGASRKKEWSDYPKTPSRRRGSGGAASQNPKTLGEFREEPEAPKRGLWFSSAAELGQEVSWAEALKGSPERVGCQIRFSRILTVRCGVPFIRCCGFCQFLSFEEGKGKMGKAKEGFFALGLVLRPIYICFRPDSKFAIFKPPKERNRSKCGTRI